MRVFMVDSQPTFRERLKSIIGTEPDLTVAGEAATCRDMPGSSDADLLILDEELGSLELLNSLRKKRPRGQRPFVLVFTKHAEEQHAAEMLKAGADGCLCKSAPPLTVLSVVRKIAKQCKRILNDLAETSILSKNEQSAYSPLSLREYQVLCLFASGMSMTEIAGYLSLSIKTISAYRSSLFEKLHFRTNAQMIRYARESMVA